MEVKGLKHRAAGDDAPAGARGDAIRWCMAGVGAQASQSALGDGSGGRRRIVRPEQRISRAKHRAPEASPRPRLLPSSRLRRIHHRRRKRVTTLRGAGHKQLPVQQGDTYASFNDATSRSGRPIPSASSTKARKFPHEKLLGGTIGVSCDMCHPDASNTHPELSKIPSPVATGGVAARHDRVVHRESGQGQDIDRHDHDERCARSRPISSRSAKASPSITATLGVGV